jgi:hypothetical protein
VSALLLLLPVPCLCCTAAAWSSIWHHTAAPDVEAATVRDCAHVWSCSAREMAPSEALFRHFYASRRQQHTEDVRRTLTPTGTPPSPVRPSRTRALCPSTALHSFSLRMFPLLPRQRTAPPTHGSLRPRLPPQLLISAASGPTMGPCRRVRASPSGDPLPHRDTPPLVREEHRVRGRVRVGGRLGLYFG